MLKQYLENHGIQQKELAQALKIDKFQMSKIANHRVMPTPEQCKIILEYLNCDVKEIFPQNFIGFKIANLSHKTKTSKNKYYRLSVRLNKTSCNRLNLQNLNLLGYKTLKSWIEKQIKLFEIELREYQNKLVNEALQEMLKEIQNNPEPTQEEITNLVNQIMQKYFSKMPQCAELLHELINQAYSIVKTHHELLKKM